jgi:phosphoribosylformylglycinamidine (FGAM) synthase-like amidotransferase family enzyme
VRSVKDWFMPKRNLRIIKRVKNVPVIGICESCQVQFQAEHQPAGQQSRAQAVIQQQFNAHKCLAAAEK